METNNIPQKIPSVTSKTPPDAPKDITLSFEGKTPEVIARDLSGFIKNGTLDSKGAANYLCSCDAKKAATILSHVELYSWGSSEEATLGSLMDEIANKDMTKAVNIIVASREEGVLNPAHTACGLLNSMNANNRMAILKQVQLSNGKFYGEITEMETREHYFHVQNTPPMDHPVDLSNAMRYRLPERGGIRQEFNIEQTPKGKPIQEGNIKQPPAVPE